MDGVLSYVSKLSLELSKYNINVDFQIYEEDLKCMLRYHGLNDLIEHSVDKLNAMHEWKRKEQAFIDASETSKSFIQSIEIACQYYNHIELGEHDDYVAKNLEKN